MSRRYVVYDVFADRPLAGNQLAVILDGAGLETARMQAIARELNLSETVFVNPPANPAHQAALRIFTPGRELPFAGHPTVGTAIALAEEGRAGDSLDVMSVLEEGVGPVRCLVRLAPGAASFAEFDLPKLSSARPLKPERDMIADALGVSASDIGFENHTVSLFDAGVPFILVPLRDLSAIGSVAFNPMLWQKAAAAMGYPGVYVYLYCRGGVAHDASFHARMFDADSGIGEDPATGAAVAAMSGAIQHFDRLGEGHHALRIEQGVEMGRPSLIHLHLDIKAGAIARARIGGQAVKVASGTLEL